MQRHAKHLCLFLLCVSVAAQNKVRDLGTESWQFHQKGKADWHPAKIPGTVHTDLLANTLISDPFFGTNEKQLQWIEDQDWEYQTQFLVTKAEKSSLNAVLQFDGLDTYATVFLNGQKILEADNMFRSWRADVKKHLKVGQNTLRIVFASAVKKGKEAAQNLPYTLPGDEKVFTRKAQYHYGWDWGPRFATAGVWKKASLHFWDTATIVQIRHEQKKLTEDWAALEFTATIQATAQGKFQFKVNDKTTVLSLHKGSNTVTVPYAIKNPKRWWPNGLGAPHLYPFSCQLYQNDKPISSASLNIGLRTIELVQEKDAIGQSFYFKVNDIPVFMKGANVIPPDSFLPRATDSVYKILVRNAVAANMNMLRVWGGGVYPDDAFYDACDRNGILVWQDFMFACAMYPGGTAFLENVKNEVTDNVVRLQNHPSLALWCGNNESDEGWKNWGWQKQYQYTPAQETAIWNDYQQLFHELIPQTLSQLLPANENRYWPSSPSVGWGKKESLLQGDSHYWGVWWGMEPFEVYQKKVGRFMSEYGFQGMPNLETFRIFADEKDLMLESEAVKSHQKHPTGYQTINTYMARDYRVPSAFGDYVYVSQLLQADGMKTAIEAHRRAKPYCMGTLYWQLNDCWPVTSWSSADYFGRWKALHYQVKRSFENVLLSVTENDTDCQIFLINDQLAPHNSKLQIEWLDFSGKLLDKAEVAFDIAGNSSQLLTSISKERFKGNQINQCVLAISCTLENGQRLSTLHYLVKPKDLVLTKPNITISRLDPTTIEVASDVLAKNVMLSADGVHFSDNYFDLLPNQKMQITLSKPSESISVQSLFDTMQ